MANCKVIENQGDKMMSKAIDFFCGGGGMTCGLRQAGIDFDDMNRNGK